MAMIAAGLFVVDRFLIASDAPLARCDRPPVIAVLPFEVVGSAEGASLADGLHHDLLTRLSKLRAFAVISRTSMLEYRDTTSWS
jgi:TolB-like protein